MHSLLRSRTHIPIYVGRLRLTSLCLASVNGYQVFTKYFLILERWIGCKLLIFLGVSYGLDYRNALPFSKVFHSLTKDTIVHELEEVFFEIILCFGSESCIHLYI